VFGRFARFWFGVCSFVLQLSTPNTKHHTINNKHFLPAS